MKHWLIAAPGVVVAGVGAWNLTGAWITDGMGPAVHVLASVMVVAATGFAVVAGMAWRQMTRPVRLPQAEVVRADITTLVAR